MTIVPPRDFWPTSLDLNGVLYATAPLSISSLNMSVADASLTTSGVVNLAAQSVAGVKNFNDGLTVGATQTITSISPDSTFVIATDNQLATKKATKDYIIAVGPTLAVLNDPLYYNVGAIDIHDADTLARGVITSGAQNIGGTKTFKSTSIHENSIDLTSPTTFNTIQCPLADHTLSLQCYQGASIQLQGLGSGANLLLKGGTGPSSVSMYAGSPNLLRMQITDTSVSNKIPINVTSATTPQMTLSDNALGNVTFSVTAGDLTIDASGNDINMHSTDKVHVLNTTAASSKITGALQIAGGVGCSKQIWSDSIVASSTISPQYQAIYTAGNAATLSANSVGAAILDSTGSAPVVSLSYNGTRIHAIAQALATFACEVDSTANKVAYDPTHYTLFETSSLGSLTVTTTGPTHSYNVGPTNVVSIDATFFRAIKGTELNGAFKFADTSPVAHPSGTGPFVLALSDTDTIYTVNLDLMVPGAQVTGISSSTMYNGRVIELHFISTPLGKTVNIDHEDLGTTAAYRIWTPNSSMLGIDAAPVGVLRLYYDSSATRWFVTSYC